VVELEGFRHTGKHSSSSSSSKSKSCKQPEYGKSGKNGKGKGSTCAPSPQPSMKPSPLPSMSSEPSISDAPSVYPSESLERSEALSASPTDTFEPSEAPSSSPTDTFEPSSVPSKAPSDYPSISMLPTISTEPSSSSEPSATDALTDTFLTISNPEGFESTCERNPPVGLPGTFQPQRIVFLYNLYVPEGTERIDAQSSMRDVEKRLHDGLSAHFLTCDAEEDAKYGTVKDFYIWSISSAPPDIMTFDECTQDYSNFTAPPENSDCFQVFANFAMSAFFPTARRQALEAWVQADQQVLDATGDFLDVSMEEGDYNDDTVLQTQFQGFVMPGDPANGPNVAGANTELQTNKESRVAAGAVAMGLAFICLLAVILLTVYRRNRRAKLYLQHLEEMSKCSDLYKDGASDDHTVNIINDGSFDWVDNNGDVASTMDVKGSRGQASGNVMEYQHDVHKVCELYSEMLKPTCSIEFASSRLIFFFYSVYFCILHCLPGNPKRSANISPFSKDLASCSGNSR
jgi:hypothetical protein